MHRIFVLAVLLMAAPATAKMVGAEAHGFEVRHSVVVHLSPLAAYRLLGEPSRWWSAKHSYSGKAANMTLALKPGGCFCEALPGGGVEHLRVAVAMPGERLVMTGALGPLLYEASAGVMDVTIVGNAEGGATVTMDYKAAGFANGNGATLAPLVDGVLTEQLDRFAKAASGKL